MKILFIWTEWGVSEYRKKHNLHGGIGYYRIIKPAQALKAAYPELEIEVRGADLTKVYGLKRIDCFGAICNKFDLIWTKGVGEPESASALLSAADHFGKPVILDIDDNFMAVRPDNPAFEAYDFGKRERLSMGALTSLATHVVCSTEPLAKVIQPINANLSVIPNCNDLADWPAKKVHTDGKVRIGYMGSVTHNADLQMIVEPMKAILAKYPHVEFEILGAMDKETSQKYAEQFGALLGQRITFYLGTPAWKGYPELLSSLGWDIGLAPLVDDDFNRSKSHIKWMEYSALKIPTVASKTYPYKGMIHGIPVIESGKTGYLVKDTDYWVKYLSELIENRALREQVGLQAYEAVKKNWQYSSLVHRWKQLIEKYGTTRQIRSLVHSPSSQRVSDNHADRR